jgi:hypothetical protein
VLEIPILKLHCDRNLRLQDAILVLARRLVVYDFEMEVFGECDEHVSLLSRVLDALDHVDEVWCT